MLHLLSLGLTFDAVYAGNMERQKDTAWELTSAFKLNGRDTPEPQLMPEFNEYNSRDIFKAYFPDVARDFPELTSDIERLYTDKKAFQRVFEKIVALWIAPDNAKPGVESWQEFSGRVRSGLRQVMAQNGRKKKIYLSKDGKKTKVFPALEWLAAMCSHIPNPGEQMARYYGSHGQGRPRKFMRRLFVCITQAGRLPHRSRMMSRRSPPTDDHF